MWEANWTKRNNESALGAAIDSLMALSTRIPAATELVGKRAKDADAKKKSEALVGARAVGNGGEDHQRWERQSRRAEALQRQKMPSCAARIPRVASRRCRFAQYRAVGCQRQHLKSRRKTECVGVRRRSCNRRRTDAKFGGSDG